MAAYLYGKSNSQGELLQSRPEQPQQSPQNCHPFNKDSTSVPTAPQHNSSHACSLHGRQPQASQLQIFRQRLSKDRRNSVQPSVPQSRTSGQATQNFKSREGGQESRVQGQNAISRLLDGSRPSKDKKDFKTLHNFFFRHKHKACLQPGTDEEPRSRQHSIQFDDEQFRKSRSIMLIRKLAKTKEKLAQHRRDKEEQEFHQRQEIPIHHTQYYFAGKTKTEPSSTPQKDSKTHERTNRAIQDIIRLQQALKQHVHYQLKAEQEVPIFSRAIPSRFRVVCENLPSSKQYNFRGYKRKTLNGRPVKPVRKVSVKDEEGDFGPWKRNISGDFQGFL